MSLLQVALEALYGLERRRDKHDLEGTIALLRALGDPHRRFRSVHVAGTNGKGSVCALIERVLREAGFRTGLYTSPHLVDFRERIRVSGRWAEEDWLAERLQEIALLPDGLDRTFFEVATALAFQYFAEQQVEVAVVEVGLGGRLDCTNVLTPEVSVITPIGLDHTEILGDTLEKIAAEKAGIIKTGVPVVVADGPPEVMGVIAERARAVGAPLVAGRLDLSAARGDFPLLNQHLALGALAAFAGRGFRVPPEAVERGFALARWPGRFERCPDQPRLWWDGAHNVEGMMQIRPWWGDRPGPAALVLALSADKDLAGILEVLRRDFPGARIFAARSKSERAVAPGAIVGRARSAGLVAVACGGVPDAVRDALAFAGEAPVLLTGSLFAVGEAMAAFGGAPGEML